MEIQFSDREIDQIRRFLDQVNAGKIQELTTDLVQTFPEWNAVFLLLRKLLAYGAYYVPQPELEVSYQDLQRMSTKTHAMLATVQTYFDVFDRLLATYSANHHE